MDASKRHAVESLIKLALELTNASQGSLLLSDASSALLRFEVVAVRDGAAAILVQTSQKLLGQVVRFGEGATGMAAESCRPQLATRSGGDNMSHVRGDGVPNAVLAVPVIKDGTLLGVLTAVCFDADLEFSEDSARQYQLAAAVVAELL